MIVPTFSFFFCVFISFFLMASFLDVLLRLKVLAHVCILVTLF